MVTRPSLAVLAPDVEEMVTLEACQEPTQICRETRRKRLAAARDFALPVRPASLSDQYALNYCATANH